MFYRTLLINEKRGIPMNDNMNPDEAECPTVTLTLDDDTEIECMVLTIFPVDDKDYIALLPLDSVEDSEEEGEVYLYRYEEDENGDPNLSNIEEDDEYDIVADAFDELLADSEDDDIIEVDIPEP